MLDDLLEASRIQFPPYLTPGDKRQLFDDLRKFPQHRNYYWSTSDDAILQGDGIRDLPYIYLPVEGEVRQKPVRGMIISNSCDIASANDPSADASVLFAPIASLDRFLERYEGAGKTENQVNQLASTIRQQEVTRLFYLPARGSDFSESIVPLDDIRPEPLASFYARKGGRIFSLSQYGFWLFLIKLSIHFTRMQESVRRVPAKKSP